MRDIAVVNGQLIFVDASKDADSTKVEVRAILDIVTTEPKYCLDSRGDHYLESSVHQLEFTANIEQVFAMAANFTSIGVKMQEAKNKMDAIQRVAAQNQAAVTETQKADQGAELRNILTPDQNDDTRSADTKPAGH